MDSIAPQNPGGYTPPPEELLHAAREWIWRHSSQPDGDRWPADPKHLDWAAENLLCDLAPWLISESDLDDRAWQAAGDWHAGYQAGLARGRGSRIAARLRRLLGREV